MQTANQIYKERPIDKLVTNLLDLKETVLLVGEAGSGKTTMCEKIAGDRFVDFLRIALDDSATLRDFIGTIQAKEGKTFFNPGLLLDTIQKPSVILFDEFNSLPPSRLFFLHELLDHRRLFVKEEKKFYKVHEECQIVLACNPPSTKYSGTNRMNAALIDRCSVVHVPIITPDEVPELFELPSGVQTAELIKAFETVNDAIQVNGLRTVFSLRAVKRIKAAINAGITPGEAYKTALINGTALTGGPKEAECLTDLLKAIIQGI